MFSFVCGQGSSVPLVVKWADSEKERQARRAQKAQFQASNMPSTASAHQPSLFGALPMGYIPPYNGISYQVFSQLCISELMIFLFMAICLEISIFTCNIFLLKTRVFFSWPSALCQLFAYCLAHRITFPPDTWNIRNCTVLLVIDPKSAGLP